MVLKSIEQSQLLTLERNFQVNALYCEISILFGVNFDNFIASRSFFTMRLYLIWTYDTM